jgi:hypothetical protein
VQSQELDYEELNTQAFNNLKPQTTLYQSKPYSAAGSSRPKDSPQHSNRGTLASLTEDITDLPIYKLLRAFNLQQYTRVSLI